MPRPACALFGVRAATPERSFLCILLPDLPHLAEEYGEEREEKRRDSAGKSDGAERAVSYEHRYDVRNYRGDKQHAENEEQ